MIEEAMNDWHSELLNTGEAITHRFTAEDFNRAVKP
jgi:hypothetical protein